MYVFLSNGNQPPNEQVTCDCDFDEQSRAVQMLPVFVVPIQMDNPLLLLGSVPFLVAKFAQHTSIPPDFCRSQYLAAGLDRYRQLL